MIRIRESVLEQFATDVFTRLDVARPTAELAVRSLLDASLMGIDSHGIGALAMYVNHIRGGGLDASVEPVRLAGRDAAELWDMRHGFGLAGARKLMSRAIEGARKCGTCLLTCRNANHLGACGVYGKLAADQGLIAMVAQQSRAALSPWGGRDVRIGASPLALVAPVAGAFPFYFDASMAAITRGRIKAHMRAGRPLPEGSAMDAEGSPTTDAREAWVGQLMPIGRHKGPGLAMALEVLSGVLSGNRLAAEIPSIVDNPDQSAGSSVFMTVIDPEALSPAGEFADRMRQYVEYVESSAARDPADLPRYPGRREGENWQDRKLNGIVLSDEALERLRTVAQALDMPALEG